MTFASGHTGVEHDGTICVNCKLPRSAHTRITGEFNSFESFCCPEGSSNFASGRPDTWDDRPIIKILQRAIETVKEREALYGSSVEGHARLGNVLRDIFGEVTLKDSDEFIRFYLLATIVSKLCRYTYNFEDGGHRDSIHDAGNYCFLLEVEDDRS